jgi:hypothetical protein
MAWVELGFMDDSDKEYLGKDAKTSTWLELTAKIAGVEATEA